MGSVRQWCILGSAGRRALVTRSLSSDVQPDVTHASSGARRGGALVADRVQCYAQPEDTGTGTGRWKVSVSNENKVSFISRLKGGGVVAFG